MKKDILIGLLIAALALLSYQAHCLTIKGYCEGDCYFFPYVGFHAQNVSNTYATSLLWKVQDIIHGYLGAGQIDRDMMFSYEYTKDIMRDNPSSKPLTLMYSIIRNEDKTDLSVVIQDFHSNEVYLSAKQTSSFFMPNDLLSEFSVNLANELRFPTVNKFNYKPKNSGFSSKNLFGIMLDDIFYPEYYEPMYKDLTDDLSRYNDVPAEIITKINNFVIRKKAEQYVLIGFGAIFLSSTIALLAISENDPSFNEKTNQELWQEPRYQLVLSLSCTGLIGGLVSGLMFFFDRPRGAINIMNDWIRNAN